MIARLMAALGVRPAEVRVLALVTAVFATLEAGRGVGEVGANTLVVSRLSAEALPYLYVPLGIISLVAALGYGAALGRIRRARLFASILVAIAGLLVAERIAVASGADAAIPLLWLTVNAAGAIAVTIGWTVAGATFDARQAKRLFPLCTAAAIVGNFAGALAAGPLAGAIGTESLVMAQAALMTVAAVVVVRLGSTAQTPAWGPPRGGGRSVVDDLRLGFDEVRRTPLLRLVAAAYVLFAILLFSVSFPFLRAADAAFPREADLAAAIGAISAAVTGASFVVSLFVANRFYTRFGIATAALVLPLVYLVGFGIWIVQFSFVTAVIVQSIVQVTQRGLSNAAWTAFYNVVPAYRRAQVLAFTDGVPGQIGIMLSGILLLTAGAVLAPEQVFWMGAIVAAVAVVVVVAIRRRYAASLLRTLRSGAAEQVLEGGPGLGDLIDDPDVRRALVAALAAPEPRVREMAAEMLARSPAADTLDALLGALDDEEPAVRSAAAVALIGHDAPHDDHVARAEGVIDVLLRGDGRSRVAGLVALRRLGRSVLLDAGPSGDLDDPRPAVRAAAIGTLANAPASADVDRVLLGALEAPAAGVRRAAAAVIAGRPDLQPGVVERLDHPDGRVQEAALLALAGRGPEVRDAVATWAAHEVDRAARFADALEAVGRLPGGGDVDFLTTTLADRLARLQDLVLGALVVLGSPEAGGVIRRCLRSDDADLRAQAVETLDSIGDPRVAGALIRLIERSPSSATQRRTSEEWLDDLRHDDDPWIRVFAARIAPAGDDMPDATRTIGEIETMLQLRRVPLFERLAPEDLQRVASVAVERSFDPGEVIVREGDVGEELFVILDGQVRVIRMAADGSERFIRRYGPGDHIGELAVLRERPRAATVVAEEAVRTLVLGGDGLKAILQERPEAAMAMLATLAERISIQ